MLIGNIYPDTYYSSIPSTTGWNLSPGADGLRTVYGQFYDLAGNSYYTTDTITLDTQAPQFPKRRSWATKG